MPESRDINKLDPGLRRGDDLFRVSLNNIFATESREKHEKTLMGDFIFPCPSVDSVAMNMIGILLNLSTCSGGTVDQKTAEDQPGKRPQADAQV